MSCKDSGDNRKFQACGEIESNRRFEFVGENMMEWINIFGAVFIAVIMVPNIIFTLKCKDGFENKWNNKGVEVVEQIGRFGCFGFMVVNIPGTWFGWWSDEAFAIYLIGQNSSFSKTHNFEENSFLISCAL